jgi:hypothetical protein
MLHAPRIIKHAEVVGDSKHSQIYHGFLEDSYEKRLREFFTTLAGDLPASGYGEKREAWLIGEVGTVGDYKFGSFTIKRHDYDSWIWKLGRLLYHQTGRPLDDDQFLVAFIPHYADGGSCGVHQDKEPNMRDDWIVSLSLGATVQFEYGVTRDCRTTIELKSLAVLGMSRYLWHAVPPVKGDRWNITFRCWKADYRILTDSCFTHSESKATATHAEKMKGIEPRTCAHCEVALNSLRSYAAHLQEQHEVPSTKVRLVAYGLGECPYCHRFFAAKRGWSKHTPSCKARTDPDPTIEWPRKCWVWWQEDTTWYEGMALDIRPEAALSYTVLYDDASQERELDQHVVFTDPALPTPSDSDSVDLSPEAVQPLSDPSPATEFEEKKDECMPSADSELEEGEVPPTPVEADGKHPDDLLPDWFSAKSSIPDEITGENGVITPILVELTRAAAQLRRLPPLRLWRGNQRRMWARCTKQFTGYFQAALREDANSPEFLKLCLRLLELPSIVLSPTLPTPKLPSEAKASLPFKLRKAESLAFQERLHEATKILFSHGITPPSEEVLTRLQALHPPRKAEIPVIKPHSEQFSISAEQTSKALYRNCTETWKSLDPFGWSTALLHLIRAFKPEEGPSFFDLTSEFVAKLANCQVPDSVAFIFTTGSLIALNKDPENVRLQRLRDGLKPRERPINQGTMFLKLAFDLALRSRKAQEAADALLPIQQGLGAKRGMELISHTCAAFYKDGYAILKKDATNGFQEIKRAKMHRAVERRCPSLLGLFQKYYSHESIGFYNTGKDVQVVTIEDGCRMGCKLSSFGFDLTVHDAYLGVQEQLEHTALDKTTDHSFVKGATDDVVIVIKADPANPTDLYKRVRALSLKLDLEAEKVGLSFENEKSTLLLPSGWPPPEDRKLLPALLDIRSDVLEDVHKQGMEIVGCPIGSARFCKNFVEKTLNSMLKDKDDLAQLHPQAASKLLLKCVAPAPAYIAQTCHYFVTRSIFARFDRAIWKTWVNILGGTGPDKDQLTQCSHGEWKSQRWAYLPTRLGGAGLKSWSTTGQYAWYCSVAECTALQDPSFDRGRAFLKTECEAAHAYALSGLGGETYINHANFEFLPAGEPDVLCASDYYKDWLSDHDFTKLQKEFSEFFAQALLRLMTKRDDLDVHSSNSDIIRSLHTRHRPGSSVLKQLFTANLSDHEARLTKSEFTISVRQFLALPALKIPRGEIVKLKCACEAQKCPNAGCADSIIDAAGNHAMLCHGGIGARKATLLERALERAFRKSGGRSDRQPATTRLLGDIVPREDLVSLFPGGLNQEQTKVNGELAIELVDAFLMAPSALRESVIDEVRSRIPVVDESKKDEASTIRFDLCMGAPFPVDTPRQLWLDHAIVHESSESYQAAVIAYLEGGQDPASNPAFRRISTAKQRRFRSLIAIANHLQKQDLLDFQPFFLFPVISALGFLNDDATSMMKWMCKVFNKTVTQTRDDGIPVEVIKGRFKAEVRNAICFGLLRGNALAMHSAGRPFVDRPL